MRPLSGITVVAVEQAVSAPICTRHLGDLGARVIKVENRVGGDFTRGFDGGYDVQPNGVSSPAVSPYGAYPTADGQTVVLGTTNDREWQRLAREVLHRPDLADDADVNAMRAAGAI
jgi:crotonobetainyl-CoA:carnitine CoA-transferase CaiB-like acyl-CoA transferase